MNGSLYINSYGGKMCIFCKIVDEEIPAKIVYETNTTIAFLDVNPKTKGHTIIIPKSHYETFEELPDNILMDLMKTIKEVIKLLKPLNYEGYNILNNNKPIAGQEIPHVHFHLIPRYSNEQEEIIKMSKSINCDLDEILSCVQKD